MEKKIYEIMKDNRVFHTAYYSITDSAIFDGVQNTTPLTSAKKHAKSQGYTHILKISSSVGVADRIYKL